ncbi:MAG TPA: ubiquinol oxidase subunit II [Candidatus Saccharimonadales bacterium]|nr:ubiquinol oxidase subunit II [Candidatus Saccharimonadales bacterium]
MILVLVLAGLLAAGATYVHRYANVQVFNTHGQIGNEERHLMYIALSLALIVVVPVFTLLFIFAWRYRESNHKAHYSPELDHSRVAETIWWLIPGVLILILSVITWNASHKLDPYKPLASSAKPLRVQVVSLDWKWLFIYPEQHIASVNLVQLPVNRPINFEVTSDSVMNSFWIPQLGGQIYSMPGMQTELHLMADKVGQYAGSSANISGSGFADMKFTARVSSQAGFDTWAAAVQKAPNKLTQNQYDVLAKPTKDNPVAVYASADPALYDTIVRKYMGPMGGDSMSDMSGMSTVQHTHGAVGAAQ